MHKRKIGVDYGEKRIGIAVSDTLGITARGIGVVFWNGVDIEKTADRIAGYAVEYDADVIVIGLPRRTDGRPGASADKAMALADEVRRKTSAEVVMRDERYTSVIAGRILRDKGRGKNRRSGETDMMAAEIILSDYLRSL